MPKAPTPFTLGALDFSPVFPATKPSQALRETLELAPRLESFGYSRYWMAEHHTSGVAHSCPELLLPVIAGLTKKMHVGTAGVLLRLHSPLKVAKNFRILTALYPDRIDLGIARGKASDEQEKLLREGLVGEVDFGGRVQQLVGFLRGSTEIPINPQDAPPPEIWILGSNLTSVHLAAQYGTAFCFAAFLDRHQLDHAEVLSIYRNEFTPSADIKEPKCSIAVAGVCAGSDEEAHALMSNSGPVSVVPTVTGSRATCAEKIEAIRETTGVTEFIFLDLSQTFEKRLASFRLLAEAVLRGRLKP